MGERIAFIRAGSMPTANVHVAKLLQDEFPDLEVETIDIGEWLGRRVDLRLINTLSVIKEYGLDVLRRTRTIRELRYLRFGTPYLFRTIKRSMSRCLSPDKYRFSFQMQALFDASVQGLPHFMYTDHTMLANLYYPDGEKYLYSRAWIELERSIYENATLNFTWSRKLARSLIGQYDCPPHKVVCVHVAGNIEVSAATPTSENLAGKNILFVGMEWERKGGPELIEAFRSVLKAHPDAQLTIVGCSPRVEVPNCKVTGRIPVEEVAGYYLSASVFCLPTRWEPFGVVFLEAMSRKLPVVATDVGAIPEFIIDGENGYLVPPGDPDALAEALIRLLDDAGKRRSFGEAAYRLVMQEYTWERVGERIRENITSVLDAAESGDQQERTSRQWV